MGEKNTLPTHLSEQVLPLCVGKALGECIASVAKSSGVPSHEVGYEDVAMAAFGSAGKTFISTCMYTELYGICAVLFIIMVRHTSPKRLKQTYQGIRGGAPH